MASDKHKVRADMVKKALADKHKDDFFLTEVKDGPTHSVRHHLKMDAMAIRKSWSKPLISGYEVKVERSDFVRDDKWMGYLGMCHEFSFVCPKGLIEPAELPEQVGLIYYNPETRALHTKRKAVYRLVEIPANMLMYIIMNRLDNERHPFFSDERERIEAYIKDKGDRYHLSEGYKHKIAVQVADLEKELSKIRRQHERFDKTQAAYDRLKTVAEKVGCHGWFGDAWVDELEQMLLVGAVSSEVRYAVESIERSVIRLREAMGEQVEEECVTDGTGS
ncbi:hypothetical protein PSTEL_09580 [Paenibacillus stellifer]|uniref:Uncharacterized protein n=1 Tax=Paenibacillus stellifer TaxID=169760 RepID=A0A089LT70_9BACL|nr:hypothetical protein [Paenibacillus stellifer]AIQ63300.1 hypothetical protein PSTEL_09580 [Paenibacillus stellifer]